MALHRRTLDAFCLQDIFFRIIRRYCPTPERIAIRIDESALASLTDILKVVTGPDVSDDPGALVHVMADVATAVYCHRHITVEELAESRKTAWLDFAIECALCVAGFSDYSVLITAECHHCIARALIANDWAMLRGLFDVAYRTSPDVSAGFMFGSPADASEQGPADDRMNRRLSTESYSNLRAVADSEYWTDSDILVMIDEYLNPSLNPELVHYTPAVVSGDEWRRLYRWIHRYGGRVL
jgi:hypothetical protein